MLNTISNKDIKEIIRKQIEERFNSKSNIGLKINLYRNYEVIALAEAAELLIQEGIITHCPIESIMVGDSYFTTHLGKSSTQLLTEKEQHDGMDLMISLIEEVREAMNISFSKENRPYLIGDMPDGSLQSLNVAIKSVDRMINAGADVIKAEITSDDSLSIVKTLCDLGYNVMVHVGYTPQKGTLRRYGGTMSEAHSIFSLVKELEDSGVISIVLEMVDEVVNQCLCSNSKKIQIYSIFSGKAKYGAQSLNVWDSFFKPGFENRYFPPTAQYSRSEFPEIYTKDAIKLTIYELMKMTLLGEFPKSPPSNFSENEKRVLSTFDPWSNKKALMESFVD